MIREIVIVKDEMKEIKQEIKILKENVLGRVGEAMENKQKSFAGAVVSGRRKRV